MNDDFHDIIRHGDAGDQSNQPRVDTGVLYAMRGDEHHNFPGANLSDALLTVARAMGSSVTEVGLDAGRATAPLSGILV